MGIVIMFPFSFYGSFRLQSFFIFRGRMYFGIGKHTASRSRGRGQAKVASHCSQHYANYSGKAVAEEDCFDFGDCPKQDANMHAMHFILASKDFIGIQFELQ